MISLWTPVACRSARASMLEGIEGRLEATRRYAVEDHVARCGACAEELADLAAAHHAARRALEPLRLARARVAPARARLAAGPRRERPSGAAALVSRIGRPPEHAVVFAVLALLFFGSLPNAPQRSDDGRAAGASYVRAADDPGGLLRSGTFATDRIPVYDGLVIDVVVPAAEPATSERPRQGLRSATPK